MKTEIEEASNYMLLALEEARKADERGDYGVGAIIVLDNKIISRAGNRVMSSGNKYYEHAEIRAIRKLWNSGFDDREIYNKMTIYATLSPCPQCWGQIQVAGIRECIYGYYDAESSQNYEESRVKIFENPKYIWELGGNIGQLCHDIFAGSRDYLDQKVVGKIVPRKSRHYKT